MERGLTAGCQPPQRLSLRAGCGAGLGSGMGPGSESGSVSGSGSGGFPPAAPAAPQLSWEPAPALGAGDCRELLQGETCTLHPLPAPAPGGTAGTGGCGEAGGTGGDLETSRQRLPVAVGPGRCCSERDRGALRRSQPGRARQHFGAISLRVGRSRGTRSPAASPLHPHGAGAGSAPRAGKSPRGGRDPGGAAAGLGPCRRFGAQPARSSRRSRGERAARGSAVAGKCQRLCDRAGEDRKRCGCQQLKPGKPAPRTGQNAVGGAITPG